MALATEHKEIDDEYFKSYHDLEVHRLMISDHPRTQAYCDAISKNATLFRDKVVMDVGAGTGILSLFAAKSGAKIVHAVEASPMAKLISSIAKANDLDDKIKVHQCRVESLTPSDLMTNSKDEDEAPHHPAKRLKTGSGMSFINQMEEEYGTDGKVDIIISEWMGFYLLHESMLHSVLFARDTFLKDSTESMMFPRIAKLYAAPCSLKKHYDETINFWNHCYGFNFEALKECALKLRLTRPEIDCIDESELLSKEKKLILKLDLMTMKVDEVESVEKELVFVINPDDDDGDTKCDGDGSNTTLDGIALWFDCIFTNNAEKKRPTLIWKKKGNDDDDENNKDEAKLPEFERVVLSTSPSHPNTHWKQTLIFLPERIKVKKDDVHGFQIRMKPSRENPRLYNIELNMLPHDHMQCALLRAVLAR